MIFMSYPTQYDIRMTFFIFPLLRTGYIITTEKLHTEKGYVLLNGPCYDCWVLVDHHH